MASEWRYNMILHEPNGRAFTIAGTGNTQAAALAELTAKAAMTVGTQEKVSFGGPVTDAIANNTDAVYSDAVLVLRNGAGEIASVHLENISVVYGLGAGQLDLTADDIVAFATAYRDGRGLGGYTPFGGEYVA